MNVGTDLLLEDGIVYFCWDVRWFLVSIILGFVYILLGALVVRMLFLISLVLFRELIEDTGMLIWFILLFNITFMKF